MDAKTKLQILKALGIMKNDIEKDVAFYDGKAFNGKNVSEYFGKQAAVLATLTDILIIHIGET